MTGDAEPSERRTALAPGAPPALVRTALALLPFHVVLRGGEALLPLAWAGFFGRTAATDLYYLLAAYFVFGSAIVTGAFQDSGAVAVLIEVGATDPELVPEVAGALFGYTLIVGSSVALAMGAVAAIVAGVAPSSSAHGPELVAWMALGTIATGVRAFHVGLLNARAWFRAHPLASGAGMALTWTVLVAGREALGIRIVPVSLLAGELLAIAVLAALARRCLGVTIRPNLRRSPPIRKIFALVRLEVTGGLITRINPVVDQLMAAMAGVVGGGTLLRYAGDVASLPTSLLQATLFPVLLTRLAHEAGASDAFRRTLSRTLAVVCSALVALALAATLGRAPLCALLYGRGAMDPAGVSRIAAILPWALAGAVPFGALLVLARAHVALQNSRIMPGMGVLNTVLNAALNALFLPFLGLAGIALSTSVTYGIVAAVFWARLPRAATVTGAARIRV